MDTLTPELQEISKNIVNKPYFYKVFLYFVKNTNYTLDLLSQYCNFVNKYKDYNEDDKHVLYDTNIKPFINSFLKCSEEDKINLNYYNNLNYIYNDIISLHLHVPLDLNKKYNVPKYVYNVLFFIFEQNELYFARNLALLVFKIKFNIVYY